MLQRGLSAIAEHLVVNPVIFALVLAAGVNSLSSQSLSCVNEMRYLGVYIDRSRSMKCSLDACKRDFYRADNSIFG